LDDPAADEYLLYLGACWAIANEYDVSLRTLNRALWVLDITEETNSGVQILSGEVLQRMDDSERLDRPGPDADAAEIAE
jgi:hypothetical protein